MYVQERYIVPHLLTPEMRTYKNLKVVYKNSKKCPQLLSKYQNNYYDLPSRVL